MRVEGMAEEMDRNALIEQKIFTIKFLGVLTDIRVNNKSVKTSKGKAIKVTSRHFELISYLFKRNLEGKTLDFTGQQDIADKFKTDTANEDISVGTVSRCLDVFYAYGILSMKVKDDVSDEDDSPEHVRPLKIRFQYGKYTKGYYAEGEV
jgi:hypothetical protein